MDEMVDDWSDDRFGFDAALRRHMDREHDWTTYDDERLDSESPWEAAFEYGEELAREEQTMEADWDED
jgi:hypothetical protein